MQHNVKASRAKMVQHSQETATVYSVGDHVTVARPQAYVREIGGSVPQPVQSEVSTTDT